MTDGVLVGCRVAVIWDVAVAFCVGTREGITVGDSFVSGINVERGVATDAGVIVSDTGKFMLFAGSEIEQATRIKKKQRTRILLVIL